MSNQRLAITIVCVGVALATGLACGDENIPCTVGKANCPPATAPKWHLKDFQPKSARFNSTYGLEAFLGKPTIVALLSGW